MADAPKKIKELVELFERNESAYKSAGYKEEQLKQDFLNPFFDALGWKVYGGAGVAPQHREVIFEDSIKIAGGTKAPDYCFTLAGRRMFFVEAKKPSIDIKEDIHPAFQLRRYGWSAKLPLSILTDFEEFAVYESRTRPKKDDKASTGRIIYLKYKEYVDKWDEIYDLFSKEAVLQGSLDRVRENAKKKRGTQEVDDEFLNEIESWRDEFARNIAIRNPDLSVHELNYSVQRTIDRIIFLRMCEDRGIERYEQLKSLVDSDNIYDGICEIYKKADEKYNSGLFHFKKERDRDTLPDDLTLNLSIDDKLLKTIINHLYYPDSPYEFSVLPPEILGNVYERFLGKVIRLTPAHRAKVEEKPEVRKAGGVYYTPQYIVDYIVENTVGELCKGKTPKQITELRILDPACGSGSFLLGAYTYLLKYHLEYYTKRKNPQRYKDQIYQGQGGEWFLTIKEKKRILLNNIYGVDIDHQAVEVTKLSLLLKVLEGESKDVFEKQQKLWRERALPDLGNNIKCGNSLIGPDFYSGQTKLSEDEEMYRINAFDWGKEFKEIIDNGGFDVVIGNPPYVRQELLGENKTYFQQHYNVYHGAADLYVYFIERSVSLLKPNGYFSYIVANKWLRTNYGKPLRQWMKLQRIVEIVDFGDLQVFKGATTYPCILNIQKSDPQEHFSATEIDTLDFSSLGAYVDGHSFSVSQSELDDEGWPLVDEKTHALLTKLSDIGLPLGEYVNGKLYRGVLTGLNKAFVIDSETRSKLIAEDSKSEKLIKPFLLGRDIKRYLPPKSDRYLIFTRRGVDIKKYPAIEKHLLQFKEQLIPKPSNWEGKKWPGRKPGNYRWYEIQDTIDYYAEFEKPKITYLVFQVKPAFTFDSNGMYANNAVWIIPTPDKYLLAVLNSKLGWFLISENCTKIQNGYQLIFKYLGKISIRTINFDDPEDVARHDKMVALVERMVDLNKKMIRAKSPNDNQMLQRQIDTTDQQIDQLVYELYGLTEEEINIIEASSK